MLLQYLYIWLKHISIQYIPTKCTGILFSDYTKSASGEGKCSIKEKKASLEVAQQETRSAQQQLSEHIRKLDAARARVRVLESEVNSFKGRLEVLADKGVRDGELIHILQVFT